MTTAYIGIGANLGDRAGTMSQAVAVLGRRDGVQLIAASGVYETAPVGVCGQPDYLNAVLEAWTDLSARDLLNVLLGVEGEFGRRRRKKWDARTLDLDVLLFGNEIIQQDGLQVPHPRMHERGFVLVPLCDLCPEGCHPVLKRTYRTLAQTIDATQAVRRGEGIFLMPVHR